jgi:HEPN domain-containing protein
MTEQRDSLREALRWIEKAEHDIRNADHTLTLKKDCPLDTVCFHAQQGAEKCLKALLVFEGVDFPRTHDLVLLLHLVPKEAAIRIETVDVHPLNRYSVETRYPGEWAPFTRKEAENAVLLAKKVRKAVKACLRRGL